MREGFPGYKVCKKKVISHFKVGTYDLAILLFVRKKKLLYNEYPIEYKIIILLLSI